MHRIGYGKGLYDSFLPKLSPETPKIGLAYELQLVECIDAGPTDFELDMIITEKRIIAPKVL
jgi:5-formyltetrahydrofolate cyclo-ligase